MNSFRLQYVYCILSHLSFNQQTHCANLSRVNVDLASDTAWPLAELPPEPWRLLLHTNRQEGLMVNCLMLHKGWTWPKQKWLRGGSGWKGGAPGVELPQDFEATGNRLKWAVCRISKSGSAQHLVSFLFFCQGTVQCSAEQKLLPLTTQCHCLVFS